MRFIKTDRLYCFSPPVMIATFALELVFAIYILLRYKLTPVSRLAVFVLVGLAIFQLAEYNICEGVWGVDSLTWARIGYIAITFLPPLGLHLAVKITGKKQTFLTGAAYISAIIFSSIFLFIGQGLSGEQCLGNYVIFDMASWVVWPYAIYYYGILFTSVAYALYNARHSKKKSIAHALYALTLGYLAFIIPTTTVNLIDPSTVAGIPSIMCGFAVILAVILTGRVIPLYYHAANK
ncbi:MAG TPA: histidine kinase N-terminal 7TM domain-containing protein [Candidatus Saccharimonadales bacterium]|nr:histidine kinase N-terminal 7TM domain-containing protein [Candidatus Saccharimonadales bacterium]